jgi:hypothetical protein
MGDAPSLRAVRIRDVEIARFGRARCGRVGSLGAVGNVIAVGRDRNPPDVEAWWEANLCAAPPLGFDSYSCAASGPDGSRPIVVVVKPSSIGCAYAVKNPSNTRAAPRASTAGPIFRQPPVSRPYCRAIERSTPEKTSAAPSANRRCEGLNSASIPFSMPKYVCQKRSKTPAAANSNTPESANQYPNGKARATEYPR